MKITLFGGAFDPPHNGHLQISRELLRQQLADEVWFLPVKYHAFDKQMLSDQARLAMLSLIIEPHTRVEIFELTQNSVNFTYHTLKILSQRYPEHTFSFVIGSDNLGLFHQWDKFENLVEEFTFFVYPRKGYPLQPLQKNMILLEGVTEVDVSSTQVRERLQSGESISDLVPAKVEQYIQNNALYKGYDVTPIK